MCCMWKYWNYYTVIHYIIYIIQYCIAVLCRRLLVALCKCSVSELHYDSSFQDPWIFRPVFCVPLIHQTGRLSLLTLHVISRYNILVSPFKLNYWPSFLFCWDEFNYLANMLCTVMCDIYTQVKLEKLEYRAKVDLTWIIILMILAYSLWKP